MKKERRRRDRCVFRKYTRYLILLKSGLPRHFHRNALCHHLPTKFQRHAHVRKGRHAQRCPLLRHERIRIRKAHVRIGETQCTQHCHDLCAPFHHRRNELHRLVLHHGHHIPPIPTGLSGLIGLNDPIDRRMIMKMPFGQGNGGNYTGLKGEKGLVGRKRVPKLFQRNPSL